jgi:hypothetical protein
MHPPYGWLSRDEAGSGQHMAPLPVTRTPTSTTVRVQRPDLKLRVSTRIEGGEVNRGMIGAIIGVLVIIILVIVILQMT